MGVCDWVGGARERARVEERSDAERSESARRNEARLNDLRRLSACVRGSIAAAAGMVQRAVK
jgi:hypothetical protein